MFGSLFRILRPIRLIKRRALTKGLFGGDRKWLVLGGIVFAGGKIRDLFGFGEPEPVYVEEIERNERMIVAHSATSKRKKRRKSRSKS
jgi:hypothetical protein